MHPRKSHAAAMVIVSVAVSALSPTSASAGTLDVTPLTYQVTQTHPAPAAGGDTYSLDTAPSTWHIIALRSKTANDTLSLYNTEDRQQLLTRSALASPKIDFVAAYYNNVDPVYAVVTRPSGTGSYAIEASSYGSLSDGNSFPYTIAASEVVREFDSDLTSGETTTITVNPSNKLDVSVFLMWANGSNFQPRKFAAAEAHAGGKGATETLVYDVPASGRYAVVVLVEGGHGNYTISRTDS